MDSDWFFFDGGPGSPRYGGDPTKHAFKHDTETFVREVLQNANDQAQEDSDGSVEVHFRFLSLSGSDLEEFQEAIDWDHLVDHVESVAGTERGRGYRQFLNQLEDEDELRLLVIEDRNTTGLTGSWEDDASNYTALVRDELYSSKQDDTAGGSYGLGKSVLWTFSGLSTAVFNSVLSNESSSTDHSSPRLIGRTKLPTHRTPGGDVQYQGAGWLCDVKETPGGVKPRSFWDKEAEHRAEKLHVSRPQVSGTSAMVVGYRDPTRDTRPEFEELAEEFVTAAVKYFWPAIHRGDLEVVVETPGGTHEATSDACPMVEPFGRAYSSRFHGGDELEQPGDVASRTLGVRIPPRADGTPTANAKAVLSGRLAAPTDDFTLLNHVAMFRGAGMVVKYYDQSRVAPRDRDFFAVLACGEARTPGKPSKGDVELDRFLRFAEPPTHDEWESTENLKKHYQRGYRKAVVRLIDEVREGLRNLVSRPIRGGGRLPDSVLRKFPIHSHNTYERIKNDSSGSNEAAFDLNGSASFSRDRWKFYGSIEPLSEGHDGLTATVGLTRMAEDGREVSNIPITEIQTESDSVECNVGGENARIVAEPDTGHVVFSGQSQKVGNRDFSAGRVGEIRLEIDTEVQVGGEQA